jgi:hypothetical protein
MRVRLRQTPFGVWVVESKLWFKLSWKHEESFYTSTSEIKPAYERARQYAVLLKHPTIEEIT